MARTKEEALVRMLQGLLTPVLAFCLRRSLRLREITEITKAALVQIASEELQRRGDKPSVSKIALMTGVHRKDCAEILKLKSPRDSTVPIARKVIGQWRSDKRFLGEDGKPRPLALTGGDSEFAKLVRTVSLEMNPYTVLYELERSNSIQIRADSARLIAEEYVPVKRLEQQFALVASDVRDLITAAETNIHGKEEVPHLHISTTYDNVSVTHIPVIKRWFMREGAKIHERARNFLSRYDADLNPKIKKGVAGARVSIGTFSLTEAPRGPAKGDEDEKRK